MSNFLLEKAAGAPLRELRRLQALYKSVPPSLKNPIVSRIKALFGSEPAKLAITTKQNIKDLQDYIKFSKTQRGPIKGVIPHKGEHGTIIYTDQYGRPLPDNPLARQIALTRRPGELFEGGTMGRPADKFSTPDHMLRSPEIGSIPDNGVSYTVYAPGLESVTFGNFLVPVYRMTGKFPALINRSGFVLSVDTPALILDERPNLMSRMLSKIQTRPHEEGHAEYFGMPLRERNLWARRLAVEMNRAVRGGWNPTQKIDLYKGRNRSDKQTIGQMPKTLQSMGRLARNQDPKNNALSNIMKDDTLLNEAMATYLGLAREAQKTGQPVLAVRTGYAKHIPGYKESSDAMKNVIDHLFYNYRYGHKSYYPTLLNINRKTGPLIWGEEALRAATDNYGNGY